jgi:hypothetical protein
MCNESGDSQNEQAWRDLQADGGLPEAQASDLNWVRAQRDVAEQELSALRSEIVALERKYRDRAWHGQPVTVRTDALLVADDLKAALHGAKAEGPPKLEGRIRLLERAVGNCFMMAKREIARHVNGKAPSDPKGLERWQHVQRFCETTGSKSSILRGQLPDEITEGSGSDRPDSERP